MRESDRILHQEAKAIYEREYKGNPRPERTLIAEIKRSIIS